MAAVDSLVIAIACSLLFVHALKAVRDALSFEWRATIHKAFAAAQRRFDQIYLWKREVPDDLSIEVDAQMRMRQVRQFRGILPLLKWYSCFCSTVHLIHLGGSSETSMMQDALVVVGNAMCLVADWCPWLVTERSVDVWYSGAMAIATLYTIPAVCSHDLRDASSLVCLGWVMLTGLGHLNLPLFIFWNGVRIASAYWEDLIGGHWISGEMTAVWLYYMLGTTFIGVLEAHMKTDCRRDVERQVMEEKQIAMDALLGMAFDVVVEPNGEYHILGPAAPPPSP